ncbi:MAG TPA: carboxylating nicotinate-nucleotide diphosphorylase [Chlamydiales bacterium]|nr:carboxylating nicotinate-nucleotide diphosphorylase [Chlamydiales bacterium]
MRARARFSFPIKRFIKTAFAEDFAHEDITSLSCIPENTQAEAHIVLKQKACIAGLKFIPDIFHLRDPEIEVRILASEGQMCEKGTVLAELQGSARSLLSGERVALNFLQHLCGVATLTARCVALAGACQILDTRKTILGLRMAQKYAVGVGGGVNHRMHLADRILIKNNHLALVPLEECVRRARERCAWIEVEVGSVGQMEQAINAGANAILLDNMSPDQVRECVLGARGRVYLEASGGITLDNVAAYAATGVNGVSIGALTHSAHAIDISMRLK